MNCSTPVDRGNNFFPWYTNSDSPRFQPPLLMTLNSVLGSEDPPSSWTSPHSYPPCCLQLHLYVPPLVHQTCTSSGISCDTGNIPGYPREKRTAPGQEFFSGKQALLSLCPRPEPRSTHIRTARGASLPSCLSPSPGSFLFIPCHVAMARVLSFFPRPP